MTALKIFIVITAVVIIALHVGSVLCREKRAKACSYVNVCLHILLFFGLMAIKISLETLALVFMLSLLIYLSVFLASYRLRGKGDLDGDV